MNLNDIEKIEQQLEIQIPEKYKKFLLNFPDELITNSDEGIFHDTDAIITGTKSARNYKEEEWEEPFANNLLVVGWNGGGSCYCIREGETGENIHLFDHEWGSINPDETISLVEFVEIWSKDI